MGLAAKRRNQKVALEIISIGETTERVIEIVLKDGRRPRIRRDLIEIYGSRAFIPKWLADRIQARD